MRIKDLEWRKPHYAKDNEKIINQATRMLFKPADKPTKPTLESLMGSLYMSCPNASAFQYASPAASATYETHDDVNVLEEIEVLTSAGILPPLKEIAHRIGRDLDISPPMNMSDVLAIEEATRCQNTNDTWKSQRIGRITSYSAHKVRTKVRKLERGQDVNVDNVVSLIMGQNLINPTYPNIPALKYGITMEPAARGSYSAVIGLGHKNVNVEICGLFIDPLNIYMGASPDAIVNCDCCTTGILEIKCPLSIAHTDPNNCSPSYLKMDDQKHLHLRESHEYHTQILTQLAVTGYEWCGFFVYTSHGYHLERIRRKKYQDKILEIQKAAKLFFSKYILPVLQENNSPSPPTMTQETTEAESMNVTDDNGEASNQLHISNNVQPPKKKQNLAKTRKAVKAERGPVYLCRICDRQCKSQKSCEEFADDSVSCDECFKWFHWGCVGFDVMSDEDEWFCEDCLREIIID